MQRRQYKIAAVVGPTASGKTELGARLAQRFGGEVVSCDSMQVYEGLDILSAKPTKEEMRGVAHHLVGYVDRKEQYSVARFLDDAAGAIAGIIARGRLPFLVGGSGLYISSLIDGIKLVENTRDAAVRARLEDEAGRMGGEYMLKRLFEIDPAYAAGLHKNNVGRIIRALELWETANVTMSEQLARSKSEGSPYDPVMIGLTFSSRAILYDRINRRVDRMVEQGLLLEAKQFLKSGAATASQAIGAKELAPYFEGKEDLKTSLERLKLSTRRYAKRQMTWFGRDDRIKWLVVDSFASPDELEEAAAQLILTHLGEDINR